MMPGAYFLLLSLQVLEQEGKVVGHIELSPQGTPVTTPGKKPEQLSQQIKQIVQEKLDKVDDLITEQEEKRKAFLLEKLGPGLKPVGGSSKQKIVDTRIVSSSLGGGGVSKILVHWKDEIF